MKKMIEDYKKVYKKRSKGKTPQFKCGLIQGLLATTNNKEIRQWLKNKEKCRR